MSVDKGIARAEQKKQIPAFVTHRATRKSKRDFSLRKPTDSSEGIGKAKASACSARNDGGWCRAREIRVKRIR